MALAIYMDAHVPAAVSAGLERRGIDVLMCQEDGADRLADDALLAHATVLERILFTQDDDLLALAKEWQQSSRPFAGVVYAHQLSCGIGELVRDLELVLSCCTADELANSVMYIPLR